MSKWIIYNKYGVALTNVRIVDGLDYNGQWMAERFVTLTVHSAYPIEWGIGDYLIYRNEKFVLKYIPTVNKSASAGTHGEGFVYSDVKFRSLGSELDDVQFLDEVLSDNHIHYTWLSGFSFFAASIDDFADRMQANLNRYCEQNEIPTAEKWLVLTPDINRTRARVRSGLSGGNLSTVNNELSRLWNAAYEEGNSTDGEKINQNITINNMSVSSALSIIPNTFGLHFTVNGRTIVIGAAGIIADHVFEYGSGNGLKEIERVADSEQQIITKLFAYGSNTNMPHGYYTRIDSMGILPNNMAVQNLMLPGFPNQSLEQWVLANDGVANDDGTITWHNRTAIFSDKALEPYVMSPNHISLGIREYARTWDGGEGDDEVHPTIEGTGYDVVVSADVIEDDGLFEDGAEVPPFYIIIPHIANLDELLHDDATISMKSGYCGGRDFKILGVEQVESGWKLKLQRYYDESLNLYFPCSYDTEHINADNPYQIRGADISGYDGDKFVLVNIDFPDSYIEDASVRLLEYALDFLADNCYTRFSYTPKVDDIFMQQQHDMAIASSTPSLHDTLREGNLLNFEDGDLGIEGNVYIDSLHIKEYGNEQLPTYDIVLRNHKEVGTIERLQMTVDSLTGHGNGSAYGGVSTHQVRELINMYGDRRFLRKDADDTAYGKVTFDDDVKARKRLTVGNFRSRVLGSGALIDEDGNAEFESIYSRNFISTPEFRYNRVSVTDGEQWNTNGFGVISDVEIVDATTGYITLKLEENDYASIAIGDICRGIFNDIEGLYETSDLDDDSELYTENAQSREGTGFGFAAKQGFFTSYFYVKEFVTNEKGECKFLYELRDSTTPHPCEFMRFAQYGSFTDTSRQSSSFSTSIGHYYQMVLDGVNTWRINPENVVLRLGYLGDMEVHMRDNTYRQLQGNGLYCQDNVYFGNAVIQLDASTLARIQNEIANYVVDFSEHVDVVNVSDDGRVIGGLYTLSGDNNEYIDYLISSAITVRKNGTPLIIESGNNSATTGKYKIYMQPHGCTCQLVDSTLRITGIDNINDGVTAVPANFDYDAMRAVDMCWVDLIIDCEGRGSLQKRFPIKVNHDNQPFISASLTNQQSSISWNTRTQAYVGLPITFDIQLWHNDELLNIASTDDVTITPSISGMTVTKSLVASNGINIARITITTAPSTLALVTNLNISCSVSYAGRVYTRDLVHTINKLTDTNVYSVIPSVSSVVIDPNSGRKSSDTISCGVYCDSSNGEHYAVSAQDLSTHKVALYYQVYSTDGTSTNPASYAAVNVSTSMDFVRFILYGLNANGTVNTSVVHDIQDVPIIYSGLDGNDGEPAPYYREQDYGWSAYSSTANGNTSPSDIVSWSMSIPSNNDASKPFLWMRDRDMTWNSSNHQYTSGTYTYTRINGEDGNSKMLYMAGSYTSGTAYTSDNAICPIVEYQGSYYYLKTSTNYINSAYVAPTNTNVWGALSNFAMVITDALFTQFAKLGSFVVVGDYMISQYGKLYYNDGSSVTNTQIGANNYDTLVNGQLPYTYFDSFDPTVSTNPTSGNRKFKPTLVINSKTGDTFMSNLHSSGTFSGELQAATGTFSGTLNAVDGSFQGELNAVTGSFEELRVHSGNNTIGRLFFDGGLEFENIDLVHAGEYKNRTATFYTANMVVRGLIGIRQRYVLVVYGSYGEIILSWNYRDDRVLANNHRVRIDFTSRTDANNNTFYDINLMPSFNNDIAIVDVVQFNISSGTYRYRLIAEESKRVLLVNGVDNHNSIYIAGNGSWRQINGGTCQEYYYVDAVDTDIPNDILGRGWLQISNYDNNW